MRPAGWKGERIRRTFSTKSEALSFKLETGQEVPAEQINVVALLDRFDTEYAAGTYRNYKRSAQYKIRTIREFLQSRNKIVKDFKLQDAEQYRIWRKSNGATPGTINREVNILKKLFSWAVEHELIQFSPLQRKLRPLPGEKTRKRWLREEEMALIYTLIDQYDPSLWWPVFLAEHTGMRLHNVEMCRPEDVIGGSIYVDETKSGKPYAVPVDEKLAPYIEKFKQGRLTIGRDLGRRFRKIVKKAGLYTGAHNENNVVFHTLRHTFATRWAIKRLAPRPHVSKWMGLSSTRMLDRVYGHSSPEQEEKIMREFSPKPGQNLDTFPVKILPVLENASESMCPHGESNPGFGLERKENDHENVK